MYFYLLNPEILFPAIILIPLDRDSSSNWDQELVLRLDSGHPWARGAEQKRYPAPDTELGPSRLRMASETCSEKKSHPITWNKGGQASECRPRDGRRSIPSCKVQFAFHLSYLHVTEEGAGERQGMMFEFCLRAVGMNEWHCLVSIPES